MTDLDVQVYKELLNAEYEKLKKASIRSPDARKGFRRTEKTDRCRDVYGGWQAGSEGHNAGSGLAWGF